MACTPAASSVVVELAEATPVEVWVAVGVPSELVRVETTVELDSEAEAEVDPDAEPEAEPDEAEAEPEAVEEASEAVGETSLLTEEAMSPALLVALAPAEEASEAMLSAPFTAVEAAPWATAVEATPSAPVTALLTLSARSAATRAEERRRREVRDLRCIL